MKIGRMKSRNKLNLLIKQISSLIFGINLCKCNKYNKRRIRLYPDDTDRNYKESNKVGAFL